MNYKEYLKLIGQKTVKPLCIMTGEEEYVKGSVLKKLKEAFWMSPWRILTTVS